MTHPASPSWWWNMSNPARRFAPPDFGRALMHPVALASLALLCVNDHLLKVHYAGWISGKLSDVCALVYFPLLLVALGELALWLLGRRGALGRSAVLGCCLATGAIFTAINLAEWPADIYRRVFEVLASPVVGAWALLGQSHQVRHVIDPTDLLALPALLVPWWIAGARRAVLRNGRVGSDAGRARGLLG